MKHQIPVIRVNYSVAELIRSLFVSESDTKYRDSLIQHIKEYFGVRDVMLTSSCRSAIFLLLKNLPQKKVIIPSYTCGVVVEAARYAEKNIIFADVDSHTLNVKVYPEVDENTIIIATHQYGFPSEVNGLVEIAKKKQAVIIEDCAGSLGSLIDGVPTGIIGDFGVFSFSASKLLNAPTKGGFIISKKHSIREIIPIQEKYLDDKKFKIQQLIKGILFCANNNKYISKLLTKVSKTFQRGKDQSDTTLKEIDSIYERPFYEWQAYVVSQQFKMINEITERRKEVCNLYNNKIKSKYVTKVAYNSDSVNIRYPILSENREKLKKDASDNGIQIGCGYEKVYFPQEDKIAKRIVEEIMYLPLGYKYSDDEILEVIDFINHWEPK